MSNFINFSHYETETEDQKITIEGMKKTQEWFQKLVKESSNFKFQGMEKEIVEGRILPTPTLWGQYKRGLYFNLENFDYHDHQNIFIKSIFTLPQYRGQGLCKSFLRELVEYSQRNSGVGLVLVTNPFDGTGWDILLNTVEGFEYTPSREKRDKMGELVTSVGFQELDPVTFYIDDFGSFLHRVILHYQSVIPRHWGFNCGLERPDFMFEEKVYQRRLETWSKDVLKNRDKYDEYGRRKDSVWR